VSAIRDARHITTREDGVAHRIAFGLVCVIALLSAYSCVSDIPERRVFSEPTVTMPRAEYQRAIAQARIDAAREAMAAKECWPGDEFKYPPRGKKHGAM
jgi:hypothetical protein